MENWSAFISYVVIVTYTPGPTNIMSMVNASRHGMIKNLPFMAGFFTGSFSLILLSCYFSRILFDAIPRFKGIMGLVGTAYLLYLAYKTFTAKMDDGEQQIPSLGYRAGIALQFINPKVVLYAITVASGFMVPNYSSLASHLIFSLILASVGFSSLALWGGFGAAFNRLLSRYHRIMNIAMGLLLVYSAYAISGL